MRIIAPLIFFSSVVLLASCHLDAPKELNDAMNKLTVTLRLTSPNPLGETNPLSLGLKKICDGMLVVYEGICESASSAYDQAISAASVAGDNAKQAIMNSYTEIKAKLETLEDIIKNKKSDITTRATELITLVENSSSACKEALAGKINDLADQLQLLKQSNEDKFPEAQKRAQELIADLLLALTSVTAGELDVSKDVSYMDSAKYYGLQVFRYLVKVFMDILLFLLTYIDAATLVTGVVVIACIYLSIKLSVAFVRVVFWVIKLPFRIVYRVFRYIFGSDKELEINIDTETIKKDCSIETGAAVPMKGPLPSSGIPRKALLGDESQVADDIDDDEDLAEDEVLADDVEEDADFVEMDDDVVEVDAANDVVAGGDAAVNIKASDIANSAMGYSSAVALAVAAMAFIF